MHNKEKILFKSNLTLYLIVFVFILLGIRIFKIQIIDHSYYAKKAFRQQYRKVKLSARRGDILSSNGKLLARSIQVYSLYAVPRHILHKKKFLNKIFSTLSLSAYQEEKIRERIHRKRYRNYLWITRHLLAKEYNLLKKTIKNKKLRGLGFVKEFKRYYPKGSLLSHVLGFTNIDGQGLEGLEKKFQKSLNGQDGHRIQGVDALGKILQENPKEEILPHNGSRLVLTIDSIIQNFVEEQMNEILMRWKPKALTAIVLDVNTGKILALANRPNYNPNFPRKSKIQDRRNRAITDYYEPGSTIKVFTALAAVREKAVSFEDTFFCHHGVFQFGPRRITDTHGYGDLSVRMIVIKSSNIGMAQVGVKLGDEKVRENILSFGFGKKTGIELPGEEKGKVTSKKRWSFYSTTSVSMGYEIGVTALQLATAYGALVNGGYLYRPTLIEKIIENKQVIRSFKPQLVRRVYKSKKLQQQILSVLEGVVEEGTAKSARLKNYRVGGKTGTARRNARGKRGYTSKYLASFVAVAPISHPKIVVVIMADSPKGAMYGGTVSAPSAARIINSSLSYLGVAPDKKAINRESK